MRIFAYGLLLSILAACGADDGGDDNFDPPVDAPRTDAVDAPPELDAPMATCFDEEASFSTAASMNAFAIDPRLGAPVNLTAPDFKPMQGSGALSGGATPPSDGFFDTGATFRGAIGTVDWTRTGAPQSWTQYPTNETPADIGTVTTLAGTNNALEITADTTWTAGNTVKLPANLKVYVSGGAVLTLQPGALIKGGVGSAIVVTKTGRIDAQGAASAPIVMTSDKASGTATAGDWGGLILLGSAAVNVAGGDPSIEGLDAADLRHHYGPGIGGNANDAHDCGTVRYVRIEYAGAIVSAGNEIQGLTIGACGSATTVDFLHVHRSSDDGIEIFGGTTNLRHIVISQTDDDGLDWDQGWTGKVQFMVVQQALDKAIEADSNRNNATATPIARPIIYNATFVGAGAVQARGQMGLHLRRGTGALIRSSILTELSNYSIDVDGRPSVDRYTAGDLRVESSMFFNDGPPPAYEDWIPGFDAVTGVENDCP
jgi:hypothetical protein